MKDFDADQSLTLKPGTFASKHCADGSRGYLFEKPELGGDLEGIGHAKTFIIYNFRVVSH